MPEAAIIPRRVDLNDAALQLRMSRDRVLRRIQTGELEGGRDSRGRWFVNVDSIYAALKQQAALA